MMRQILINFIEEELLNNESSVAEDQELLMSGLIDSMGVMRLVAQIENLKQIVIPPADVTLENFSTVNAMADYVDSRLTAA